MTDERKIKEGLGKGKLISICLMMFCLTFLTTINYFLYPDHCDATTVNYFGMNSEQSENDIPPSGPSEEKSTNSTGLTLAEEMLHETHPGVDFEAINLLYLHHIAEAEKIEIFHPDILIPPPKPAV
jgi:hypothetical protein